MIGELKIFPNNRKLLAIIEETCSLLLAFLFAYTGVSKVYDWNETRFGLYNQGLPAGATEVLLYGLPAVEILVTFALLVPSLRKLGLVISIILMAAFTGYVAWVWFGFTDRVPCSCGGVISSLTWGEHLIFNLVFLGISIIGWRSWEVGRKEKIQKAEV